MTLDRQILTALREYPSTAISGSDLSKRLGVTRAAISARVRELRALGYDIDAAPHLGYRLMASPDLLHADDLLARLGQTQVIGRDIRVFESTTSTNDIISRFGRDGLAEGIVVFAESQTNGRGRLGRKWISPPRKGLWFSILLRPNLAPQAVTQINIAAAVSLARAISRGTHLKCEIKWPNDILIGGKKVVGILTELSAELDHIKEVVLGIGINANLDPHEFPTELREIATSLKIEAGARIDRPALAVAVLHELDSDYARIRRGQFEALAEEWQQQCTTIGRHLSIRAGERLIKGRAESLDADGALLLRTQHGHLERIIGGDVTIEK